MPTVAEPRRRNWRWWVIRGFIGWAIIALVVLARLFSCAVVRLFAERPHVSFEESGWKRNWTLSCTPIRQQMVDDLIQSRPLAGASREDVAALLGSPDRKPYLLVEQPRWSEAMIYLLGPDHLGLDSEWLVITFDGIDRVADVQVVTD